MHDRPDTAPDNIDDVAAQLRAWGVHRIHSVAWRDLDDPDAGGSEVHADNIYSRWAATGLEIIHRTSTASSPRQLSRHGYVVRQIGGRYGVFPREIVRQLFTPHRYDAVVEIWNGVPWFSSIWARRPHVTWMHHIHTHMWRESLPAPLAPFGPLLESRIAPPFYKRSPLVTLAEPTRQILLEQGFSPDKVHVVSPGISDEFRPLEFEPNDGQLRLVAVGRLAPVKQFDDLINVVDGIRHRFPAVHLTIVGDGPERRALSEQIATLDLGRSVTLAGRVEKGELVRMYQTATLLVSASHSEGWGMTITEAAACGTPAVVLDNEGHRAAVGDAMSGLIASSLEDLSTKIMEVLGDSRLRQRLAHGALERSRLYTWDNAARLSLQVLANEVQGRRIQRT